MAFIDMRLDPRISFRATGGPAFSTDVVRLDGGDESTNQNWEQELGQWEISYDARRPEVWKDLMAFFRKAAGRANSWRYKDWLDYEVAAGEGVFEEIDSTHFQMQRRYTVDGQTYDRDVTKPISATVSVTGGSGASIAASTGIVTVSSGTPTAWTGQFDKHARFDTDRANFTILDSSGGEFLVGWQSIPIVEVRGA